MKDITYGYVAELVKDNRTWYLYEYNGEVKLVEEVDYSCFFNSLARLYSKLNEVPFIQFYKVTYKKAEMQIKW